MPMTVLGPTRQSQGLEDFAVYGFPGLLNIKSAPQEVADTDLTQAVNVYGSADGAVNMRRGMTTHGAQFSASPGLGMYRFFQQVLAGAPVATISKTIAQVGGTMWNVDTGTQIGGTNALGANAQAWSVAPCFDPTATGGATDCLAICTGDGGPYLFNGTTITTPAVWSTSVPNARWCAVVNGVLWFAGVKAQPNLVWGSGINAPETLPFYNEFTVSRPVTGLGVIGAGAQSALVVGMTKGLSVLSGVGPNTFFLQEIPSTDGVAAGRTMIAVDAIVYYLGNSAIYSFDGTTITPISTKVEPWILNDPIYPDFPMNGSRLTAWAYYYNRRVYFFYDSGQVGHPNTALVWDLNLQGWTIYTGPKLVAGCLLDAPGDASPPLPLVLDAMKGQAYNFDVFNSLSGVDDAGTTISATATTKYFKIGAAGTPKTLMRVYPEFFIATAFAGTFSAITDYGLSSSSVVVPLTQGAALWDVGLWDTALWSSGLQTFFKQRIDFNIEGEAFAFSVSTIDTNPPWKFVGASGTISQLGRS